jgi:ATP-dependent protease HslVU (ClpYQ) peptidase subunit
VTTIATDGRSIAADGRTTAGTEIISDAVEKLEVLPDGSIVGGAGTGVAVRRAIAELYKSQPDEVDGDYRLLRLYPSGAIAVYAYTTQQPQFVEAPFSIGSGGEFARGAMASGASPKKAVRIAHQFDSGTGPVHQSLRPSAS